MKITDILFLRRFSIKRKMTYFTIFLVLFIVVAILSSSSIIYIGTIEKNLTQQSISNLNSVRYIVDGYLKRYESLYYYLYTNESILRFIREQAPIGSVKDLENYEGVAEAAANAMNASMLNYVQSIVIKSKASNAFFKNMPTDFIDYENTYYDQIRAREKIMDFNGVYDFNFANQNQTEPCFIIGEIVYNNTRSEEAGYLAVLVNADFFKDSIDYPNSNMGNSYIFSGNGNAIYPSEIYCEQDIQSYICSLTEAQGTTIISDDESKYHLTVIKSQEYDIVYANVILMDDYYAPIVQNTMFSLLIATIIVLAAIGILIIFSKDMVRPLNRFSSVMAGISKGNLSVTAGPEKVLKSMHCATNLI